MAPSNLSNIEYSEKIISEIAGDDLTPIGFMVLMIS
jgi:hypothetical protein